VVSPPRWQLLGARELLATPIFRVAGRTARSPASGREHEFVVLETPDWVNVIPLTDGDEVVMVRQYRHGTDEVTLEIPGGMVDARDLDAAAAARRELAEETGLEARVLEPVGSIEPNPAIQTNRCWSFVARGLAPLSSPPPHDGGPPADPLRGGGAAEGCFRPLPDPDEELEVVRVPLAEVPALIAGGKISHALVVVAFWHFWHR
jgi:8-oxo-dGTP pyrophosphatase MutT (NUDIX family)